MTGRQLSFFSASARPLGRTDVEGLLCGPGQIVRQDAGARVSVVIAEPWRVGPLIEALQAAGLAAEKTPAHEAETAVRTAFDPALLPLAEAWQGGGAKRPPRTLALDGPRLRFWALAAGWRDPVGYLLRLGATEEPVWPGVGAALAAAGLASAFVGPRADGPAYRITGVRRMSRLRELVGDRPTGVPEHGWPDETP